MADALIRLLLINYDVTENKITKEYLSESYCDDKLDGDIFPIVYQIVDKYQQKFTELVDKQNKKSATLNLFYRGGKRILLIHRN